MAPRKSTSRPTGLNVEPLDNVPAEVSPGLFLPQTKYRARFSAGDLRFSMDVEIVGGEPCCIALTVSSSSGVQISGATLRAIPIGTYLTATMEVAGFPFSLDEDTRVNVPTQVMIDGRKRRPQSELLPIVVNAYRSALTHVDARVRAAPTQFVADQLHYERGHISRLLSEARKQGLLGPAKAGRAGESTSPKEHHHG